MTRSDPSTLTGVSFVTFSVALLGLSLSARSPVISPSACFGFSAQLISMLAPLARSLTSSSAADNAKDVAEAFHLLGNLSTGLGSERLEARNVFQRMSDIPGDGNEALPHQQSGTELHPLSFRNHCRREDWVPPLTCRLRGCPVNSRAHGIACSPSLAWRHLPCTSKWELRQSRLDKLNESEGWSYSSVHSTYIMVWNNAVVDCVVPKTTHAVSEKRPPTHWRRRSLWSDPCMATPSLHFECALREERVRTMKSKCEGEVRQLGGETAERGL